MNDFPDAFDAADAGDIAPEAFAEIAFGAVDAESEDFDEDLRIAGFRGGACSYRFSGPPYCSITTGTHFFLIL